MRTFTIGADPELFLIDEKDSFVSVIDKIGGTKTNPNQLPLGDGFAVQEDNVAVEFNIPPARNAFEFKSNIFTAIDFLSNYFNDVHKLRFSKQASANFPKDQLVDPRAQVFGCDPDYNAWTRMENKKPSCDDFTLRSAGGHIHVGFEAKDVEEKFNLIKCMDLYHGVPSVFMDKDEKRKKLYGESGACRIKPYGVEYRVLSNYWVHDLQLIQWIWEQTEHAINALDEIHKIEEDSDYIIGAINDNNIALASYLVDKYKLNVIYD